VAGDPLSILHEATLRLLERTGVGVESGEALAVLAAAGVRVDRASRRAFLAAKDVERALDSAPRCCGSALRPPRGSWWPAAARSLPALRKPTCTS
jgi:trimethylamine:corrinoid methyltransferase-like protein